MLSFLRNASQVAVAPISTIDGTARSNNNNSCCKLCLEPNIASKRKCCNALFCDHCYTKNESCPNCKVMTRQEKLTGATYQLKVYSEHEECRACLEPGICRRCCNNYYCDACYYRLPLCRACGSQVGHVGDEMKLSTIWKALLTTNVLGWAITIFTTLSLLAFFSVVLDAELRAPVGLSGYTCYGFFRTCGVTVCLDMDDDVATGASPLPPLSSWKRCTLDSRVKLQALACPFDRSLYFQSQRQLGYDVCQSQFNKGLYVFEDTFEHWRNTEFESNEMVSATWMDIVNAYPDRQCGVGQSFGGRESLRFGGPNQRLAETADMDLSTGGALEFELFIPPLGYDIENEFCKTGFQGNIFVEFSTNHGANWTQLMEYEPAVYRADHFFPVSLVLPGDGHSNTTRFRFEQRNFEAPRDNWALDNVRVLKYLPRGWHSDDGFQRSKREAQSVIQEAQCCLDTDWCEKRYSVDQFRRICSKFDWYKGIQFQLRLSEMLLLVAVVINLVKFVYVSIQDWLMKSRYPFQDEVNELLSLGYVDSMMKRIPLRYRLKKLIPDEYTNNIHRSARMEQAMRDQFADEEGKGDLQQSRESIESERRKAEKRIEKMRKRIERRKAKKNFKGSDSLEEMLQLELEETLKLNELQAYQKPKEGGFSGGGQDEARLDFSFEEGVGTDLDTFQRQNHALLRVPFNIEHDPFWRHSFGAAAIALFVVLFSVQVGLTTDYTVTEEVVPYGNSLLKGAVVLTAGLQLIFAAYCDAKEIWHAIKHVVPLRDKWIPQVTLDLSDEGRALIVGHNIVPIADIKKSSPFSERFVQYCAAGYGLGVFPWCVFALLLRSAFLKYSSMRIVTPALGLVVIMRAVLGPGFVLKIASSLSFFYALSFETRELIGVSFQTENTRNTALNTALGLMLFVLIIVPIVAFNWLAVAIGCAIVGGAIYGAFTGCMHNLPIRPWMYLTTLRAGVWMRLRRRQECPFIYWGKYCTEMHNYEEVHVLFVTDEVKFTALLNGGINAAVGMQKNGGE